MKQDVKKLIIAKNIGFCFGVTKAVNLARKLLDKEKKLLCLGDLVHNAVVMDELKNKGFCVIKDTKSVKNAPFIIRSHGLPPSVLKEIKNSNVPIFDATCSFVKKVQNLVKTFAEKNFFIFLVGDSQHPEIQALKEIAGKNCLIISPYNPKVNKKITHKQCAIIAQTTLSSEMYKSAIKKIVEKFPDKDIEILNTICPVSIKRQQEAKNLAKNTDLFLVVGGKKSSNTKKLFIIGKNINNNTYQIEKLSDLENIEIEKFNKIGIISGASTDINFINILINNLKHTGYKKITRRK
jgi:4-hydroxy-3-methylbut-2-enyl diphosphate reductase